MTSDENHNYTSEINPPARYIIPSGIQTPIALKTLPDGVCTYHEYLYRIDPCTWCTQKRAYLCDDKWARH
jgi:hypothetical protein